MAYVIPAEFYNVPAATLQTWLLACQQAVQDLTTGGKVQVAAYTQGDGNKSVTYTRADLPALTARIKALIQATNGGYVYSRRPISPLYL